MQAKDDALVALDDMFEELGIVDPEFCSSCAE